jgi:hypothetical protein
MANLQVSGGITINLLQNGDNLNTTLNATKPLYQTFKKGTSDFVPDWANMNDADRPIVFPRVYSVMDAALLVPTNVSWKYNNVAMTFDGTGLATAPSLVAGKIRQIDYNGSKALKIVGNVASETNNDSDTITFTGNVTSGGQVVTVSADITLLVEEASNNLYRLFLLTSDDVIDGDQTQISLQAALYNNGALVITGVQYEFLDQGGTVLKTKSTSNILDVTKAMVDSELMVVCKAYVNNVAVAQEQKQVWDATDPYTIVCDKGTNIRQRQNEDVTYSFSLLNARTGAVMTGTVFTLKVYKNSNSSDITSQFTKTNTSITITGAKIYEHKSLYVDAACTINL